MDVGFWVATHVSSTTKLHATNNIASRATNKRLSTQRNETTTIVYRSHDSETGGGGGEGEGLDIAKLESARTNMLVIIVFNTLT